MTLRPDVPPPLLIWRRGRRSIFRTSYRNLKLSAPMFDKELLAEVEGIIHRPMLAHIDFNSLTGGFPMLIKQVIELIDILDSPPPPARPWRQYLRAIDPQANIEVYALQGPREKPTW